MTEQTQPAAPEDPTATLDEASQEALREELEQARAQYQRAVADYQNLERRSREERAETTRIALSSLVAGFLPVLDDLERAVEAARGGSESGALLDGVDLVLQKFRGTLEQHGVKEIHALGQPFDPSRHEAVGTAPGPEGQVVHLARRGYALHDRVIRPAMVLVGSDAPSAALSGDVDEAAGEAE